MSTALQKVSFSSKCADIGAVGTSSQTKKALDANAKPPAKFVARQPILTRDEQVFGYELLFRDGVENYFRATDPDAASRNTLDTSMLMGLETLCGGRRAFLNCTREVLLKDYVSLLPPQQTVVEVLETVEADDLVIAACQRLKENGYLIALDDFGVNDPREALTDYADIIKVDCMADSPDDQKAMIKRYGPWKCRLLAEIVETREQFVAAKSGSGSSRLLRIVITQNPAPRLRLVLARIAFLDRYHPGSADDNGSGEYLDRPGNQVSTAGRREPFAAALPVDAGTGIGRVGSGCRTGQPASVEGRRGFRHLLAGTGVVAPGHRWRGRARKSQIAYPHYLCAKLAHPALAHPHALRLTFLCSQRPCSLAGLPRSN